MRRRGRTSAGRDDILIAHAAAHDREDAVKMSECKHADTRGVCRALARMRGQRRTVVSAVSV